MAIVQLPYPQWQDPVKSGRSIVFGNIYVGQPDTDPTIPANQLQVFYIDENDQQINLSQPLKTNGNGFVVISSTNSTVIQPRVQEANYAVTAQNKQEVTVWTVPNAAELGPVVTVIHNNTLNRDAENAHPASAISNSTGGNLQEYINEQVRDYGSVALMLAANPPVNSKSRTGSTTWIRNVDTNNDLTDFTATSKIYLTDFGVTSGVNAQTQIQQAQDASSKARQPLDITGIEFISWNGRILFDDWLEWCGSGRFENTLRPLQRLRSEIGGDAVIAKRDATVDLEHFLMEDLGIDLQYAGPPDPALDQLVSMVRITANGSDDKDITYIRCHFLDPAHECTVHNVATTGVGVSSGGTIDGVRMLFCSGDVSNLATASRNANMFKTIHGSIDVPGPYGDYPITNVVSFGNTCRGMRTLSDFKRGTRHFSHDNSTVIDMTDVASISVDGVKDGVIGANNTGFQTSAAVDTKNFYEIQGEDIEVMGGVWDADNESQAVAALLVTDYLYPAETTATYTGNQSVNVNIHGFTARNITFHAVRLINTKDCDVRGVLAENCTLDAVSFESTTVRDRNGDLIVASGNTVDDIKSRSCRFTVSNAAANPVQYGLRINDENDQFNIESPNNGIFESGVENLNINPSLADYAGGTSPFSWSSGSAVYANGSAFRGYPRSFTLNDTSNTQIFDRIYDSQIPLTQNQILYFKLWVKQGSAPRASIIVREFNDANTLLSTNFIALTVTSDYLEQARKFTASNSATAYVTVSLVPAANFGGDATLTGTTEFADVRIGRKPF